MPRVMEISTPLGADTLLFHGLHAREELGRVSEFQIDLLSAKGDVALDDILGKNVTVRVTTGKDQTRYFNGYVTRFAQRGKLGRYHRYLAIVRPWFWFLSRTADCRIFQNKTVPDIIKAVFADHGVGGVRGRAVAELRALDLLRPVPRDRPQLRQPADGARGDLLLLPAHGGAQHDGARRLEQRALALPGGRDGAFYAPERLVRPDIETHQPVGVRPRGPARRLCARRLRHGASERRAQDQQVEPARTLARRLRGVRLSGLLREEAGGRRGTPTSGSTNTAPNTRRRRRRPTTGRWPWATCSRSTASRAPTRTASI